MNVTLDQLMEAFTLYNQTIWPAQIIAYLLCLVALLPLLRPSRNSTRVANASLAAFWIWVGLMFWWPSRDGFPPALYLAAIFFLQGLLFLAEVIRPHLDYRFTGNFQGIFAMLALVYALMYPLAGLLFGHAYPQMALSVLFPCPLIVFTFGMLLSSQKKVPKYLLVIPLVWGLSGLYWASLGMWEDVGLVLVGIVGTWLVWRRDRNFLAIDQLHEVSRPAG